MKRFPPAGVLRRRFYWPASLLALAVSGAEAQIVANCGDDLQAIVSAAPAGSVIEIHGSCLFAGTLSWSGKSLTLRAAPGFTPILQGSFQKPVLALGDLPTSAVLEGLVLVRGGMPALGLFPPSALGFGGSPAGPVLHTVRIRNCSLVGDLTVNIAGQMFVDLGVEDTGIGGRFIASGAESSQRVISVQGCTVAGWATLGGTGGQSLAAQFSDCTFQSGVSLFGKAATGLTVVEDSRILGGVEIITPDSGFYDLYLRRLRIEGGVQAEGNLGSSIGKVDMESCLVVPSPGGTALGISTSNAVNARFVNLTVAGFGVGLSANATSTFENMLLFDNDQDLGASFPAGAISSSLIEDGTFAGLSGNFGGTPYVDEDFGLVPGSLGIDAGNSLAAGLGALDLYGDPRVQDGDGDGLPEVNVGAVESPGGASAAAVVINGTPPNPVDFLAAGAPKVGSVFATSVVLVATTSSTHVAVSAGAGTPYTDPAIAGLVLLQGPLLFVDTATAPGVHLFPIPAHPALVGVELAMQGFRKDGSQLNALNGLALVLGI